MCSSNCPIRQGMHTHTQTNIHDWRNGIKVLRGNGQFFSLLLLRTHFRPSTRIFIRFEQTNGNRNKRTNVIFTCFKLKATRECFSIEIAHHNTAEVSAKVYNLLRERESEANVLELKVCKKSKRVDERTFQVGISKWILGYFYNAHTLFVSELQRSSIMLLSNAVFDWRRSIFY